MSYTGSPYVAAMQTALNTATDDILSEGETYVSNIFEPVRRRNYSNMYTDDLSRTFSLSVEPAPIEKERIKDSVKELFDEFIGEIKDEKIDAANFYNMHTELIEKIRELEEKNKMLYDQIMQLDVVVEKYRHVIYEMRETINLLGFEKLLLEE